LAGKYVYCICDLAPTDIEIGNIGLFDGPVRFVSYRGIGAFIGDLQSEKITPDIETITSHQRVVEASRKLSTTLPVKFGVIFNSDKGVKEMLSKDFEKYRAKISSLKGKDEFGVKVLEANNGESDVGEAKPKSPSSPLRSSGRSGTEYLLALKHEETIRMERLRSREKWRQAINDELSGLAERSVTLRADIPQILLNCAYLVKRSNQETFLSRAELLREKNSSKGLLVHVSGPWAPYSFC
jgi:hypothetical protein